MSSVLRAGWREELRLWFLYLCRPLFQPFLALRAVARNYVAKQNLLFRDAHVRLFRDGNKIVRDITFHQSSVSPVIRYAHLLDPLAIDIQRLHARSHKSAHLNNPPHAGDGDPVTIFDTALGGEFA